MFAEHPRVVIRVEFHREFYKSRGVAVRKLIQKLFHMRGKERTALRLR